MESNTETTPKYLKAILIGLAASIIVAIIWAIISIWLEEEHFVVLAFGAILVILPIHYNIPPRSVIGLFFGAIILPITYLLYQYIIAINGYSYEDPDFFWWLLVGSVIGGGYMGFNSDGDD